MNLTTEQQAALDSYWANSISGRGPRKIEDAEPVDWAEVGRQAFRNGDPAAPCMNQQVMDALTGPVGDPKHIRIMTTFQRGWDAENMADKSWMDAN